MLILRYFRVHHKLFKRAQKFYYFVSFMSADENCHPTAWNFEIIIHTLVFIFSIIIIINKDNNNSLQVVKLNNFCRSTLCSSPALFFLCRCLRQAREPILELTASENITRFHRLQLTYILCLFI